MVLDEIRARLAAAFPGASIDVRDTTGGGDHFAARIVSDAFAGKAPLARHRAVYAALGDLMNGPIHALALDTHTPQEA